MSAVTSVLLVDHHLNPAIAQELERAAERAEVTLMRWAPGEQLDRINPPQAVLAPLARGTRRLPATVVHLADEVFPGAPVVLLSAEPLVQPYILLQGGRVTLVSPPFDEARISERVAAAVRWRRPAPVAPVVVAPQVRREDLRAGRGHAALVVVPAKDGSAPAERIELNNSLGLTAALAPAVASNGSELSLTRDVLPTLDLWQSQPDSDQLQRLVNGRGTGTWSALAHLDTEAGRWLLASPGHGSLTLMSDLRLPGWWQFPADERERVLVLPAEVGDVVLVSSALPPGKDFSAAALAKAAVGGASELADHLAAAARAAGCALGAVALEVGR